METISFEDVDEDIGHIVFDWCDTLYSDQWRQLDCPCELCHRLKYFTCGPQLIRRDGVIHNLSDCNTDTTPCFDCVICEEMRETLHLLENDDCDCDHCENRRNDEIDDDDGVSGMEASYTTIMSPDQSE